MINDNIIDWLLDSNPWTNYMTRVDILGAKISLEDRTKYISDILSDEKTTQLIEEVRNYFPSISTRHTDAKLSHYKLRILSDFGIKESDGLSDIVANIKNKQDNDLIAIRQLLPLPGADISKEWNALPCDNPLLTYTLKKLGDNDALITKQINYLTEAWKTPTGWFCNLPFVKGQFEKEQIGCPMAGLLALEVFSLDEQLKESIYAQNAFKTIKHHYEMGKSIYYFGRGKRFFSFKYPYVWYNALYMADVLSRFDFTKNHEVFTQLINWIVNGRDDSMKYKPSSIYMEYKDWEFSNKKHYSPWITFLCYRILSRCQQV